MLCIGTLSYALPGGGFAKYMPQLAPFLAVGLTNYREWQARWGVVGLGVVWGLWGGGVEVWGSEGWEGWGFQGIERV